MRVYVVSILWEDPAGTKLVKSLDAPQAFGSLDRAKIYVEAVMIKMTEDLISGWEVHSEQGPLCAWWQCQSRDPECYTYFYRIEELTVY